MGWSWALHLCQLATEEGLARGGLGAGALVKDRAASRLLGPDRPLGVAGYVGNFMVQGAPKSRVTEAGRQVSSSLEDQGFAVHGHATWLMLLQRATLSIFSAVYAFVKKHKHEVTPLWDSVIEELELVRDLLPLLVAHADAAWYPSVTASDASPWGCGACARRADTDL
eukprot:554306-Pyramimonas_sp.AAC.1